MAKNVFFCDFLKNCEFWSKYDITNVFLVKFPFWKFILLSIFMNSLRSYVTKLKCPNVTCSPPLNYFKNWWGRLLLFVICHQFTIHLGLNFSCWRFSSNGEAFIAFCYFLISVHLLPLAWRIVFDGFINDTQVFYIISFHLNHFWNKAILANKKNINKFFNSQTREDKKYLIYFA